MSVSLSTVERIERHSALAWPATEVIPIKGWDLRLSPGLSSRRVNALNAVRPYLGPFPDVLETARAICRERNVACHVRMQPLAGDAPAAFLRSLGLEGEGITHVETVDLSTPPASDPSVKVSTAVGDVWLRTYAAGHDYSLSQVVAIGAALASVGARQGFAVARVDAMPVAVGRGVVIDGLLGVFQVATLSTARRRGFGSSIVRSLMAWGADQGAAFAYLQVEAGNQGARALYGREGFRPAYSYDYWTVPPE